MSNSDQIRQGSSSGDLFMLSGIFLIRVRVPIILISLCKNWGYKITIASSFNEYDSDGENNELITYQWTREEKGD